VSCPHGHGPPSGCSSCLGAPARRVSQQDADITIDGAVARPIELHAAPRMTAAQRKGGRMTRKAPR
jgi:hypothetical protein